MKTVAALFVQADGVYSTMPEVDCWPEARDARTYAGDLPVVAHPPCQRWGRLGAANYARWGGEHNRPGNDGGCFAAALEAVRRRGGVLEHPAGSHAWPTFGLTAPIRGAWLSHGTDGWVCEVWQSAYGHRAAKRTWLYLVADTPLPARWERPAGTHQVGFQDQRGKNRNRPTLSRREANATPPAFARWLVDLAAGARPPVAEALVRANLGAG